MSQIVSLKLCTTELYAANQLIHFGYYKSRSELLREGLLLLLQKHKLKRDKERIIAEERRKHPPRRSKRYKTPLPD